MTGQFEDIARAFQAAFLRECQAKSVDVLHDELSNMLHHLYRLGELCRRKWAQPGRKLSNAELDAQVRPSAPAALDALWIRSYDTHQVARTAEVGDVYSRYHTALYGVLVWQDLDRMPFVERDKGGRWAEYRDHLHGRVVVDSTRDAFDSLAALLRGQRS